MTTRKRSSFRNCLSMVLALALCPVGVKAAEQPNFLVITVDDLKRVIGVLADRPGNLLNQLYPDPRVRASIKAVLTPNIDKLAANGILFTNAYAVAPVCNPSRISLATGTRPDLSGFTTNKDLFRQDPLGSSLVTMQQNLRNHGYFSAGIGKIFHKSKVALSTDGQSVIEDWPDTRYSWDTWLNRAIGAAGDITYAPYSADDAAIKFGSVSTSLRQQNDYRNAGYIADLLDDGFASFYDSVYQRSVMTSLPANAPFYLGLGIYLPHQPFVAPTDILSLFNPAQMQLNAGSLRAIQNDLLDLSSGGKLVSGADGQITTDFQKLLQTGLSRGGSGGDVAAWKSVVQHYLAAVAVADRSVGVALDALADSAYRDNTVVILHSDHGFNLGEKNRLGKNDVWDESTGSVFIMSKPGVPAAVVENSISLQDIYPTITSLAEVPLPVNVLGNDLSAYFANPSLRWSKPSFTTQGFLANRHAIRTNKYRYVRFYDDPGNAELYDLRSDPDEVTNLITDAGYQSERTALNTLLDNIRANAISAPVMVEPDNVFGTTGVAPDSRLSIDAWQASGEVVSVFATGLPDGISLESRSGAFRGSPASAGVFYPSISAVSDSGRTTADFIWTVSQGGTTPNLPVDTQRPSWDNATITATDVDATSLTLVWDGATDNVGVRNYVVRVASASAVRSIIARSSPLLLDELIPGIRYTISVQAVDANGNTSFDGPSVVVEKSNPDNDEPYWVAGAIRVSNASDYFSTLSWSGAADNSGAVTYSVVLNGRVIGTTANRFYSLNSLLPGANNRVEVYAIDAAGNSSKQPLALNVVRGQVSVPGIHFSTSGTAAIPGINAPFDDSTIYTWADSARANRVIGTQLGLALAANVNALHVVSDEHFYVSFDNATVVPDIGIVLDRDIVEYHDGQWSVFLSGNAMGLTIGNHGIDALSFYNNILYFSITGTSTLPGVGAVDDSDVLKWTGTRLEKLWSASDYNVHSFADVTGLSVKSENQLYLSFGARHNYLSALGYFQDEDIVEFNNGVWSMYFDGTEQGLTDSGNAIDSLSVGYVTAPLVEQRSRQNMAGDVSWLE